jgi:hypothetical protein
MMIEQNDISDESWPLDRLANFCGLMGRRLAIDARPIGRALLAVKAKLRHGE